MDAVPVYSDPWAYLVVVVVAVLLWTLRSLLRGDIATPREVKEKNRELDALKETNAELLEQNGILIRNSEVNARTMDALREQVSPGGGS
jgi:hypothetical protein